MMAEKVETNPQYGGSTHYRVHNSKRGNFSPWDNRQCIVMIIAFIRRRELRTIQNLFNLATFAAGLLIGIVSCPLQMYINISVFVPNPQCAVLMLFEMTTCNLFTLAILALTVERYISICHPFQAQSFLTARRVGIGLGSMIVYAFAVVFFIPLATPLGYKGPIAPGEDCRLSAVATRFYAMVIVMGMMLPIPFMLFIYFRIFFVLRRHIRAVVDLSSIPRTNMDDNIPVATDNRERKRWNREMKSAFFILVLIISFAIPWMTIILIGTHVNFKTQLNPFVYVLIHSTVFLSTSLNPYLYGFGNKVFRHAVVLVFCKRCERQSEHRFAVNSTSLRLNGQTDDYHARQWSPPIQE